MEEEYAVYPHDYPWSPQYENTMTLEALLEYLKAHPVKDTASGSADEDSAPTKWDTQPTEYAAGDGQQSDTVIPTESGNGAAAFLWIGLVCIVAAVILIWRKKATKLAVAIILIGVLFMGIGAYAKGSADTKTEAAQQEETRTAATEATAAAAVLSQTQVQEIPELETEFRTEEYTKAPTEATVELTPLQYWIEYCDIQRFTQEDLETFDAEECRLARNAIFAKSGRKFNDASLQAYYEQFDWYHPTVSPDSFSNSMLNDIQSYNRDLIVMYEESRGYR